MKKKMKTLDMEIALANHFNSRTNLIVPNVSWGMDIHECDLFIVTPSSYVYEIEIKVSLNDLKKDYKKGHNHIDKHNRIRKLFYAVPDYLLPIDDYIPDRAGIISVIENNSNKCICEIVKKATIDTTARPLNNRERYKISRLGAMRIWGLKKKIQGLLNK